jgi:hypothetical protein
MRKQQREPGTELVPLEYVVASMRAEKKALQAAAEACRPRGEEEGCYVSL